MFQDRPTSIGSDDVDEDVSPFTGEPGSVRHHCAIQALTPPLRKSAAAPKACEVRIGEKLYPCRRYWAVICHGDNEFVERARDGMLRKERSEQLRLIGFKNLLVNFDQPTNSLRIVCANERNAFGWFGPHGQVTHPRNHQFRSSVISEPGPSEARTEVIGKVICIDSPRETLAD